MRQKILKNMVIYISNKWLENFQLIYINYQQL